MNHSMLLAKLAPSTAKRMGLSSNHHARVWCTCMDNPAQPAGTWSHRSREEVLNHPGRLGAFDWLGVVDLRVANSGLELWRRHAAAS